MNEPELTDGVIDPVAAHVSRIIERARELAPAATPGYFALSLDVWTALNDDTEERPEWPGSHAIPTLCGRPMAVDGSLPPNSIEARGPNVGV